MIVNRGLAMQQSTGYLFSAKKQRQGYTFGRRAQVSSCLIIAATCLAPVITFLLASCPITSQSTNVNRGMRPARLTLSDESFQVRPLSSCFWLLGFGPAGNMALQLRSSLPAQGRAAALRPRRATSAALPRREDTVGVTLRDCIRPFSA